MDCYRKGQFISIVIEVWTSKIKIVLKAKKAHTRGSIAARKTALNLKTV
jgi:hypothetical protein